MCDDCEVTLALENLAALPLDRLKDRPIADLRLPVRGQNLAANACIETIGELLQVSAADLKKYRSFRKPFDEVAAQLERIGHQLPDSSSPEVLALLHRRQTNSEIDPEVLQKLEAAIEEQFGLDRFSCHIELEGEVSENDLTAAIEDAMKKPSFELFDEDGKRVDAVRNRGATG